MDEPRDAADGPLEARPDGARGFARTRRCRPSTGNEPAFGPAPEKRTNPQARDVIDISLGTRRETRLTPGHLIAPNRIDPHGRIDDHSRSWRDHGRSN